MKDLVRFRRLAEYVAWIVGTLMLCAYGGARYWYAKAASDGLAAFEGLRSAGSVPDTSTWSRQRIDAYRHAAQRTEAPDAVLRLPRLNIMVPIFRGTTEINLNRGAGHIEGTGPLGGPGNAGIAAHRDGFFRALKDVRVGDQIELRRLDATYIYRVVETRIVPPSEVSVLHDREAPAVTLVTCYPFYFAGSAPQRFIVHAELAGVSATGAPQAAF